MVESADNRVFSTMQQNASNAVGERKAIGGVEGGGGGGGGGWGGGLNSQSYINQSLLSECIISKNIGNSQAMDNSNNKMKQTNKE